jgi:hypothetical protein
VLAWRRTHTGRLDFSVRRLADHGIARCGGAQFGATTVTVTVRVMPLTVSVTVIV